MNSATALLVLALPPCRFVGLIYAYSSLFANDYVLGILLKFMTVGNINTYFINIKSHLCASQKNESPV